MRLILATLLALAVSPPAAAAQPEVLRQLMAEPLSLFDWGLAQLDRDIDQAARRTLRYRVRSQPITGSIYDWRSGQVTVFVTAVVPAEERTERACKTVFSDIVAALVETAPQGPDAAGWYLLSAFLPKGHYWANRFEDVGRKLIAVVRLEVTLTAETFDTISGDTARVRCSGRLDATPGQLAVEVTS